MKVGVVIFPGSNCDHDALWTTALAGHESYPIWHQSHDLNGAEIIVLPGGFSYGDYLRTGAMAKFSPVMDEVKRHADAGGLVIGICNGFQILTESHLLPGVLMRNNTLKFESRWVRLRVETIRTPFTKTCEKGQKLNIPIAHGDGNYYIDNAGLDSLIAHDQIVFRYEANPNGSIYDIAGICNRDGNVLGMMPHPERAGELALGSDDGLQILFGKGAC